jgi:hypothetical protein
LLGNLSRKGAKTQRAAAFSKGFSLRLSAFAGESSSAQTYFSGKASSSFSLVAQNSSLKAELKTGLPNCTRTQF